MSNLLVIMSDEHQAIAMGCAGHPFVQTPHLDRMAKEGLKFDKAFCANAFCSACRASALTGMLPSQHGVHSWIDDRNMQDWPGGWHALDGLAFGLCAPITPRYGQVLGGQLTLDLV